MMIWTMSRKYKLFLFCVRLICHLPELIWWSRSRVTKKSCQSLPWGSPIPIPSPVPQTYMYARPLEPFKSVAQQPSMLNPYFGTETPY